MVGRSTAAEVRPSGADPLASVWQEVEEAVAAKGFSRAKKEKRIASSVRTAVVAATAYRIDPTDVLSVAQDIAANASRLAPGFAETIVSAVAMAPAVSRIDGSTAKIRAAVAAAGKSGGSRRPRPVTVAASSTSAVPAAVADTPAPSARVASGRRNEAADVKLSYPQRVHATFSVGVGRDSNVFNASSRERSDTVIEATPGVEFATGDEEGSARLSAAYQHKFRRYVDGVAPNVNLSDARVAFNLGGGTVRWRGEGRYSQLSQNSPDFAGAVTGVVARSNQTTASTGAEIQFSELSGALVGVSYDDMRYRTAGLSGWTRWQFPVRVFWNVRPKLGVLAGATLGSETPQSAGPRARDRFYHVGARGEFTPRLSGEVYAGWLTRDFGGRGDERGLGLEGRLRYQATAKTEVAATLGRDFGLSSLGQATRREKLSLRVANEPTPYWRLAAGMGWNSSRYGPVVLTGRAPGTGRDDDYWETDASVAYRFNQWMAATLGVLQRTNQSSAAASEFSSTLVNLTWDLRY